MSDTTNVTGNIFKTLTELKDTTTTMILSIFVMVIVLITMLNYFYYTGTIFTYSLLQRQCKNMDSINDGAINKNITSIDRTSAQFKHALRDYYIKTAYNACSAGSYRMDYTCALKNVLKMGCRGLDFEIFSINNKPVVATSTSDSYYVKETFNHIPFDDVMKTIRNFAFSSSTAPNFQDPIFIHLRIKSSNITMYDNFAKLLEGYNDLLLDKKYSYENGGKNFSSIPLLDLMDKNNIVIVVEKKDDSTFMESKAFYEYVNMTSNSMFMRSLNHYDIQFSSDVMELTGYNSLCMTIGMPDKGPNPPNPSGIYMRETGCQMLAMRYQLNDANLEENNLFFDENQHAFVLKPERLRHTPTIVEDPKPQKPKYSYAPRNINVLGLFDFKI